MIFDRLVVLLMMEEDDEIFFLLRRCGKLSRETERQDRRRRTHKAQPLRGYNLKS